MKMDIKELATVGKHHQVHIKQGFIYDVPGPAIRALASPTASSPATTAAAARITII